MGKIFNDNEPEDILNKQWYEIDLRDLDYEKIEWYELKNKFRLKLTMNIHNI